jgi:AraC family transcriptional regulator
MEPCCPPMVLPLPARREYLTSEASLRGLRCAEARYPAGMQIPDHVHERPSITVVTGGTLVERRRRGRDNTDCAEGMLVVRPPGELHANDIGRRGVVNVELEIDPELLHDNDLAITATIVLRRPQLGRLAARLALEMGAHDRARSLLVEGLALEILALSLRESASDDAGHRGPPRWLARVYERIVAEFRADLSVADLAREAGTHPVYLARAFRAHYRVAPGELLRARRLAWAADELAKDDGRSIASIAIDAGFYDESHFARAFRGAYGVSPSAQQRRGRR